MNKEEIIKKHQEIFNKYPEAFIQSPSRINIIGEHIDYLGGNVLPANIDLYMLGAFSKSEDIAIYSYNFKEAGIKTMKNQDNFIYNKENGFLNFVLGCLKILKSNGYNIKGAEITVKSDIPTSSGLSSSAAFGVMIIKGILELYDYHVDGVQVAKLFKQVENNFMNLKNGIMDQFIIANGIKDNLMFLNTSTLKYTNHKINLGDYQFIIFNTKKARDLITSKYNERVEETSKGLEEINKQNNYQYLTEIPIEELDEKLSLIENDTIKKRVKYAVEEQTRVNNFLKAINANDYIKMGKLLNESHEGLRNLYQVSCDELDFIVDFANNEKGVLGARMTGAGFGGCAIVLIEKTEVKNLEEKLINQYQKKFNYPCEMFIVKVVDRAKNII